MRGAVDRQGQAGLRPVSCPSGNSIAALVLFKLGRLLMDDDFTSEPAEKVCVERGSRGRWSNLRLV